MRSVQPKRKNPPTEVSTTTEDPQEVYRITDTATQSTVFGTITLDAKIKIVKVQQDESTVTLVPDQAPVSNKETTNKTKAEIFNQESYQEPTLAKALTTTKLSQLARHTQIIICIEEEIFGECLSSGSERLVFLNHIESPGFNKVVKRTEFRVYESAKPNPCIQRYALSDKYARRLRVPPGSKYYISNVTVVSTGDPNRTNQPTLRPMNRK
jgi:hypothetical protein